MIKLPADLRIRIGKLREGLLQIDLQSLDPRGSSIEEVGDVILQLIDVKAELNEIWRRTNR